MQRVCVISQSGTVWVDRQLLLETSKVFKNLIDDPEKANQNPNQTQKWLLKDFSQRSLEQLIKFVEEFHDVDCKLPEKLDHDLRNCINHQGIVSFMESRSKQEIMELLFLSNFIDYPLLFHTCCVKIASWMTSNASFEQLQTPSDELICRLSRSTKPGRSL